jgi:hypothetical protein
MRGRARPARFARPTAAVDLADDAPALERSGLGDADELVAQYPGESHVAADQLKVGLADAGAQHANEHFTLPWGRRGVVVPAGERVVP